MLALPLPPRIRPDSVPATQIYYEISWTEHRPVANIVVHVLSATPAISVARASLEPAVERFNIYTLQR
jgi:hypothetical protein